MKASRLLRPTGLPGDFDLPGEDGHLFQACVYDNRNGGEICVLSRELVSSPSTFPPPRPFPPPQEESSHVHSLLVCNNCFVFWISRSRLKHFSCRCFRSVVDLADEISPPSSFRPALLHGSFIQQSGPQRRCDSGVLRPRSTVASSLVHKGGHLRTWERRGLWVRIRIWLREKESF